MIYLDYAAETPVSEEILQTFYEVSQKYIANPNSTHSLGQFAKKRLEEATRQITEVLNVEEHDVIYTSGSSESNNLAIKGVAEKYKMYGKHIITTYLEHSSVNGAMAALKNCGYEIDYVDILKNGLIDLDHLQELLREDTILVSICYVDSELGITQDIEKIGQLLTDYSHCVFHVDATQAVGKIPVSANFIDLLVFAPHKFYGIGGCGVLIKKKNVMLEPIIHGGISTTPFRSGTPTLPLIASTAKALTLALTEMNSRLKYVSGLNKNLRDVFKNYSKVSINSTEKSSPYILNITIMGIKSNIFVEYFDQNQIYVSSKSACCSENTPSRPVYAITKNRKAALSTLRISLSHLTTIEEIQIFLNHFDDCYKKLNK